MWDNENRIKVFTRQTNNPSDLPTQSACVRRLSMIFATITRTRTKRPIT